MDYVMDILKEQDLSNKEIEKEIKEKYDFKSVIMIRQALKELIALGKVKIVNNKIQIVKKFPSPSSRSKSSSKKTTVSKSKSTENKQSSSSSDSSKNRRSKRSQKQ